MDLLTLTCISSTCFRYGGSKLERARDLFETAIKGRSHHQHQQLAPAHQQPVVKQQTLCSVVSQPCQQMPIQGLHLLPRVAGVCL